LFQQSEGDAWFERNRAALGAAGEDWPVRLLSGLAPDSGIRNVLELGCSSGWRLDLLRRRLASQGIRCVGVDASRGAVEYGRRQYPGLELHQGVLAQVPLTEAFDAVIVHFVLHWVDRATLAASIAEIDRLVRDGGYLCVGDFLPDFQQRRAYHHLPGAGVFTYKQDYAAIFESLGTYRTLSRVTFQHDDAAAPLAPAASDDRKVCTLLVKSLRGFYPERT
jgi:SAM-dependent methyltransferase